MKLEFKHLHIENFKSIGTADIDFNSQGIVKVLGVNNYETNAASNGAGKSSIFMAMCWALYGRDPKGITNPSNRYTNGITIVELEFNVDNNEYYVSRVIKGASHVVTLRINGNDRSARNRTDTDKMIREDILKMPQDLFLSLIYLSQGFSNRLTALAPTARKDRLEELTGTSQLVDSFSQKLAEYGNNVDGSLREASSMISRIEGQRSSYLSVKEAAERKLVEALQAAEFVEIDGVRYTYADLERLTHTRESITNTISELTTKASQLNSQKGDNQRIINNARGKIEQLERDKRDAHHGLEIVSAPAALCPTCYQSLPRHNADKLKAQYSAVIESADLQLEQLTKECEEPQKLVASLDSDIEDIQRQITELNANKLEIAGIISKLPAKVSVNEPELKAQIEEMAAKVSELDSDANKHAEELALYQTKSAVVQHCRQLVTKSFRTFLLESAIAYMNSRLEYYSRFLFSNKSDVVRFDGDSSKLEIYLGDVLYDTLSGGESRKADLAVVLAQRDLAAEVAGTSCNILILDEIMESMDETATQVTLDLLERTSESVESLFIISHNNYSIPADATLSVIKEADRVAHVELS